ncbi:MAG TPA: RNA polymerase sigma factor [Gemmatimonadales bacterium]|jgi:RNA polymerase sigma-70 factor (ECF subfamily)
MTDPSDRVSASLEALVARFGRMVRRVGFDHGLTETDVEEVVQEVRIRIWKARADIIGELQAAYVHRTAVSAALDIIRRRRSEARFGSSDPEEDVAITTDSTLDAQRGLEVAEMEAGVARMVEALAASRRPVVRMYLQGYSREEIAELLGWSEGKTRNLLYRGLADLRSMLTAKGLGPGGDR